MTRHSRSPSPSGAGPSRRHTRDQPRSRDYDRGDRSDYHRDDRDSRNRDKDRGYDRYRERDVGREGHMSREGDRDRGYSNRPSRRSASPPPRRQSRRNSRSPPPRSSRPRSHSRSRSRPSEDKKDDIEDKLKPNFNPSGLLAAATKSVKHSDGTSTVLKYHEPPEARKPVLGWRLYVFKETEQVDLLHINRQSAYLVGRDRTVVDISIDHPSCSKQHAVIQHRSVQEKDEFGGAKTKIKPFIIDLDSTNGTHVNDEQIPSSRYYELMASDVIKFGESTREYVLLHDEVS